MSKDWRELERAIMEIARKEGYSLDDNLASDKIIFFDETGEVNITWLAKQLADQGFRRMK